MMEHWLNDYFTIRSGLSSLYKELHSRPCNIAFLGNSITAQKEGYRKFLSEKIDAFFSPKHQFINAGIGGVGSLASMFLTDDFVLRHKPDICFVECTVADTEGATPVKYIAASIEGIVLKLLAQNCKICFLHLHHSHSNSNQKNKVVSLYEKVAEHYMLPSVNIDKALAKYASHNIVYDGIHTSESGSKLTADRIFYALEVLFKSEQPRLDITAQSVTDFPFQYSQIVLPIKAIIDSSVPYTEKRFRGIIKYIELEPSNILRYTSSDGEILGILVIVDEESGVVLVEYNKHSVNVQTHDKWCDKERIQAVILTEPVQKGDEICISLSQLEEGERGANTLPNDTRKIGKSLKIIGLMVVLKQEPKTKTRLW